MATEATPEGCIVCAIRGGEGSLAVQREAVKRARESGRGLVFLSVVDLGPLGNFEDRMRTALLHESRWLAHVLTELGRQRAQMQDVNAETIIVEGQVQDEIVAFLQARHASMLLLGTPRGTTANVFGDDEVERFAAGLERRTGIPVILVRPEES